MKRTNFQMTLPDEVVIDLARRAAVAGITISRLVKDILVWDYHDRMKPRMFREHDWPQDKKEKHDAT